MFTSPPSDLWPVEVVLGDGASRTTAKVIDVANPVANVGYQTLIVEGHHEATHGAPGKWYWIGVGNAERDACQSGEWVAIADQDSSGNFTEFTLPSAAYVSDWQVGWLLQPDINVAVYLPIASISANNHTLTVSGAYGSLAPSSSGTHFRIHAPPGVERTGPFFSGFEAGTLSRFTSASSSRNLFGGYRYESPLAGLRDGLSMQVQGRQSGWSFTGLHYTLHRHYDPHLMRFTSTDPAAAPFFNLYAYCGGNPASGYDPDGLERRGYGLDNLIDDGLDIFEGVLTKTYSALLMPVATGQELSEGKELSDTLAGQQYGQMRDRYNARLHNNGGGVWGHVNAIGGTLDDAVGITGVYESFSGHDSITGAELSFKERKARFKDGLSSGLAMMVPSPPILKLAGRLAAAGLRMAMNALSKLAGMASKAWNAVGRILRAANGAKSLLTKAGCAAKNLRHLDALKSLREHAGVIYERTNVRTGAKYIGKAKNWNRFLARRAEHARKNRQIYSFRIIDRKPGGRLLSLAEEEWMRRYGGPCSYGGPLENRFAAMNDLEYVLSGGDVPWP